MIFAADRILPRSDMQGQLCHLCVTARKGRSRFPAELGISLHTAAFLHAKRSRPKLDDQLSTPFGIGVDATAMVFLDFHLASCLFFDV
jgi:hypothetical protein